ncbi:MAG: SH3 domain-containing protein, partial [Terriglobales bacterium]
SRHGRSASDGSVETCEFTAIEARLKMLAQAKELAKQQQEKDQQEVRVRTLRRELADQQARFDALNAQAQQLEKRFTELRQLAVVRSKSSSAQLKASSYARAANVRMLMEGEELDVLYRTTSWYRVRTHDGQVGWVFYSLLEPAR